MADAVEITFVQHREGRSSLVQSITCDLQTAITWCHATAEELAQQLQAQRDAPAPAPPAAAQLRVGDHPMRLGKITGP